jgi:uncharacterized protein (UPF0333 family)
MAEKICFPKNNFIQTVGLIIMIIIVIFVGFTYYLIVNEKKEKPMDSSQQQLLSQIKNLKDSNYQLSLDRERSNHNLFNIKNLERKYTGSYGGTMGATRLYTSPNEPGSDLNYRQLGFLYDSTYRYPLFGRYLYSGRTDLWEYYIVDDSRNRIKISFKSPNNKEIFDGDVVNVPTIGSLTASIYEIEQTKYNPMFMY